MSETEPIPPTSSGYAIRFPLIKKVNMTLWYMKMRRYIAITDHILWDIITNGNQTPTTDLHRLQFCSNDFTWGSTMKQSTAEPAHYPKGLYSSYLEQGAMMPTSVSHSDESYVPSFAQQASNAKLMMMEDMLQI
ncbi:hypothetical protein Tco_1468499 [Tanacetum coccineum]